MRLRQKLVDLADSVKGFFGAKKQQDNAVEKLERLKVLPSFSDPPALVHTWPSYARPAHHSAMQRTGLSRCRAFSA